MHVVPPRRLGLRGQLVAASVGAAALVSAALLALLPPGLDTVSRRWAESRSFGIAHVLGRACAVALDFDDEVAAARILHDLEASEGAVYAVLVRPEGSWLAVWGNVPAELDVAPGLERVDHRAGSLQVTVPVSAAQAGRGALVVGFDTRELEQARRRIRDVILLSTALVLLFLGIPVTLWASHVLLGPLRRVTAVASRVADGDAAARGHLPVERADEVGGLARAFAHMLERLYEKEAGIVALAGRLEQRVEERTADLARANEELAESLAELRRTQDQLVTADRRITIGRLTAGISHEINNPLAYILANLDFARTACRDLVTPGDAAPGTTAALLGVAASLDDALKGVERVRYIVRGLKNFSRSDTAERHRLSPLAPLQAALDMSAHEVRARARLTRNLGPLPITLGHEVRLAQVFVNLIVNAAQAIPEGARDRHEVAVSSYTSLAGEAVIEVADTGAGIPPEVMRRLFEPFFTTKPVGTGTGLGLAISREIVEKLGGRIEVESAPGEGSTFRVVLPPAPPESPAAAVAEPRRALPRLLVIDDEPMVRAALERSLGRDHEVSAVAGAEEALALLARGPGFDRILCDVNMPGMDGFAFRERLAERDPEAAATLVFMTGGVLEPDRRAYLAAHALVCLEKPLDPALLASVLDANR